MTTETTAGSERVRGRAAATVACGLGVAALAAMALAQAASPASPGPWRADQGDGSYRNPVLFADYSDPDAIRVGADFYLTASSFHSVPGLPILHSRDLVNWRLINHALPRLAPARFFAAPQHGNGVWAPSLRHHAGRFFIYFGDPDRGIFMTRALDPAGTWSAPVLVEAGRGLIDPAPLWDDDGQAYLVHAWARSRAGFNNVLTLHRMSGDGTRVLDAGRVVIDGNKLPGYRTLEGPKLYKSDGWYWILAPAGGVAEGWQSAFRARTIDGPYEARVVLAQGATSVNGPHQGALVDTPAGEPWFLHFQDRGAYGRVVHLQPVRWQDGWPVPGRDEDGDGTGEPVLAHAKPQLGAAAASSPATSDDFDATRLGLQWQWQANPDPGWLALGERAGWLRLRALPLAGRNLYGQPNLLLQKLPAPELSVTTTLDFRAAEPGARAGLIVFGESYAWLGLVSAEKGFELRMAIALDARAGSPETVVASAPLGAGPVRLRVDVEPGARCRFSFSRDGQRFEPIGPPFAASAGRWVGAKVGLFAVAAANAAAGGHADFAEFSVAAPEPGSDRGPGWEKTVALDGSGDFTSLNAAIFAAPMGTAARPSVIHVRPGVYEERLYVQRERRFLRLVGADAATTIVRAGLHAGMPGPDGRPIGTFRTATATIDADDFTAENLTFENSAGPVGQALAVRLDGDRMVFRRCRFLGWQDTVLANRGRHYFEDSEVAGHVDFVFGAATAWFERCLIRVRGRGYVTAASTPPEQAHGFVFHACRIVGDGADASAYLGRPWRDHAAVAFLGCEMSAVVRPEGWHDWDRPERRQTARFAEHGTRGPGAGRGARVPWAKALFDGEAATLSLRTVLAGVDGWSPVP